MSIRSSVVVDLTGPDGNAFFLLGRAQQWGRDLGYSKEEIKQICRQMQESDYINLLRVFKKAFPIVSFIYPVDSEIEEEVESYFDDEDERYIEH